jgi:hypothetical protein
MKQFIETPHGVYSYASLRTSSEDGEGFGMTAVLVYRLNFVIITLRHAQSERH